jgi:hypothetical protein
MFFEKLPYESLSTSIYEGLDSSHGTNIDEPASTVLFYYDLNKVERFERSTRLGALLMGFIMSIRIMNAPISFSLFFVGMSLMTGLIHCCLDGLLRKGDLKSRMALPGIAISPNGLTIVGSVPSVTAPQIIPWDAINSATVSKKISGCTIIEIFLHDSEEARLSVQKMGVISYRDYSIVQKFLSNLIPDNKRVSIFGDHLYVAPNDVVKIINERKAIHREQKG